MPVVYKEHKINTKVNEKDNSLAKSVYAKLKHLTNSNPVSSFAVCPPGVRFATQDPDEKVILLLRQHPIVNLGWILVALIMLLMPILSDLLPLYLLPDIANKKKWSYNLELYL